MSDPHPTAARQASICWGSNSWEIVVSFCASLGTREAPEMENVAQVKVCPSSPCGLPRSLQMHAEGRKLHVFLFCLSRLSAELRSQGQFSPPFSYRFNFSHRKEYKKLCSLAPSSTFAVENSFSRSCLFVVLFFLAVV
jgi:hypothetical protein